MLKIYILSQNKKLALCNKPNSIIHILPQPQFCSITQETFKMILHSQKHSDLKIMHIYICNEGWN